MLRTPFGLYSCTSLIIAPYKAKNAELHRITNHKLYQTTLWKHWTQNRYWGSVLSSPHVNKTGWTLKSNSIWYDFMKTKHATPWNWMYVKNTYRSFGDSDFDLGSQREQTFDERRLAHVASSDKTHLRKHKSYTIMIYSVKEYFPWKALFKVSLSDRFSPHTCSDCHGLLWLAATILLLQCQRPPSPTGHDSGSSISPTQDRWVEADAASKLRIHHRLTEC